MDVKSERILAIIIPLACLLAVLSIVHCASTSNIERSQCVQVCAKHTDIIILQTCLKGCEQIR